MVFKFIPAPPRAEFPGNYVWCLNTETKKAYALLPDGTTQEGDRPYGNGAAFWEELVFALQAVKDGAWQFAL